MTEKISEWKQAKELCESFTSSSVAEQIELVKNSNVTDSIKAKALLLINKMGDDFKLLEANNIEKLFKPNLDKPDLSGKCIDDYELLKLLGSGGMSSVYLAKRTQTDIQKLVALKILSPYATDEKYLELFNREQKSLAQLNHNNIVSFHHGGQTEDGTKYLVMDYVEDGKDVISYINDNNFNQSKRIQLIREIAETMSYAHSKGIIHRDLKAANILMDTNGALKIVDFGISLFVDSHQNQADDSTRCFTLDIASPEQILGHKIDARTDIFSLGALFLQMLTGKTPLPKVQMNHYKPIDDKRYIDHLLNQSELAIDLQNIVSTAMHIDLEKRYQYMRSFVEDLDNFQHQRPVKATSDSIFYKTRKLVQRNPNESILSLSVILVCIVAFALINSYKFKSQKAENKNANSMAIIDALFEQASPFIGGKNSEGLVKTLEAIEKGQTKLLDADPEFSFHFYQNMTEIYNENADYNQALIAKRKAISALKLYVEDNDPLIINTQIEQYRLLHAIGDYSQAIVLSQELLQKLIDDPKSDPELTVMTYITLSRSYASLNQLNDESRVHQQATKYMDEHPELNPEIKADFLASMAITQYRISNKEMANELFEKAIKIYKSLPNRQKSLVETLRNYAATNVNYGDFDKAEALFKESIDLIKSVDSRHPTLASTYLRYASLLAQTNRLQAAEDLLTTAVEIFIEANDTVELSVAYGYLAELALRKNKIDSAIKHILAANQFMFEQQGLDHPKTLKKYNLSLWILLIEPYQNYAKEVIDFLNKSDYVNSTGSKEYQTFQFQKALINKAMISTPQDLSLLSEYLYSNELISKDQKINWLEQHLSSSDKYSTIVNALFQVWLMEFKPTEDNFNGFCINSSSWMTTTMLVLKMELMHRCLSIAETNNYNSPLEFIKILQDLDLQIGINEESIKQLVDQLIHPN
jgi:serine/threonine-protein kinase